MRKWTDEQILEAGERLNERMQNHYQDDPTTKEHLGAVALDLQCELNEAWNVLRPACIGETLVGAIRNLQQETLLHRVHAESVNEKLERLATLIEKHFGGY